MNKWFKMLVMVSMVLVFSNGCMSYLVYQDSTKKVAMKKAVARGDQAAIRAIDMGGNGAGIGIDVTNLEALKEQPLLQLGAAIVDALMIYGGAKGVESLNNSDKEKGVTINVTGNGNTTTANTGDNNSNMGNPNYSEDNSSGQ